MQCKQKRARCMLAKYEKTFGGLPAAVALELYNKMTIPLVTYGVEFWGFQQYKQVEDIHVRPCKKVYGLPLHAMNMAALGECERYPIFLNTSFVWCIK